MNAKNDSGGGLLLLAVIVFLALAASKQHAGVAGATATPVAATTGARSSGAIGSWPGAAAAGFPGIFDCIARAESGGDPHAVNPRSGAAGLLQDMPATWHELGGSGSAADASVAEQLARNLVLYHRYGTAPWRGDSCV